MAASSPKITIAKPPGSSTSGVLPIPASATQKDAHPPSKGSSKAAGPRLKVVIRRLPPGLKQSEFESLLGEEWKLGGPYVDWMVFKPGKISKDPAAKLSRPARAYLHLTAQEHLATLSEKVRSTTFADARNTRNDPSLLGPPSLEFAPYNRIPSNKRRNDARQGTIDQDPEFMEFLMSLTEPIQKPTSVDADGLKKEDKPTITPLVQYLKEKKASKSKDGSSGKSSRHSRQESKESRSEKAAEKKIIAKPPGDGDSKTGKDAKDKAAKEAVKVLNRVAAGKKSKEAPSSPVSSPAAVARGSTASPTPGEKKRERGNAAAAASILRRDLGLGGGGRRSKKEAAAGASESTSKDSPPTGPKADSKASGGDDATSKPPKGPSRRGQQQSKSAEKTTPESKTTSAPSNAPTGPSTPTTIAKKSSDSQPQSSTSTKSSTTPPITPGATQAFLKHANPSQGITEALLRATFAAFGTVTNVEIDRKKGFGYVDFADSDGLLNAVRASPVKVAEGQVVVNERKDRAAAAQRAGPATRGRGGGDGGGSGARGTSFRGGRGRGRGAAGGGRGGAAGTGATANQASPPAPAPAS